MKEIIKYIQDENLGTFKENVSFKMLTTYRAGGEARLVYFPDRIDSLIKFLKKCKELNIDFKVFGNGSNILASDDEFYGVIIKLTKLDNYVLDEKTNVLTVDAGYNLMKLANDLSKKGYSGLEFACGIPGTVGGALYMNAGAYLKAMSDIVIDATLLDQDDKVVTLTKEELDFSYRKSILQVKPYICLRVRMQLEKKDLGSILSLINDRLHRRIETQPLDFPSAGSIFRNPLDDYAGRLIEECDLKGKMYGGAEISEKHANFIINKNNAQASDIKYLMDLVQKEVYDKFKIKLHREQELFNFK